MTKTEWQWFIDQMGKPIPCALCHAPRLASELREVVVPARIIFGGSVVVDSVQWVCADGCDSHPWEETGQ